MRIDAENTSRIMEGSEESLVVLAEHENVDVVIPGNEAVMADRSKQGAIADDVRNMVGTAECVDKCHDAEQDLLVLGDADGPIARLVLVRGKCGVDV